VLSFRSCYSWRVVPGAAGAAGRRPPGPSGVRRGGRPPGNGGAGAQEGGGRGTAPLRRPPPPRGAPVERAVRRTRAAPVPRRIRRRLRPRGDGDHLDRRDDPPPYRVVDVGPLLLGALPHEQVRPEGRCAAGRRPLRTPHTLVQPGRSQVPHYTDLEPGSLHDPQL